MATTLNIHRPRQRANRFRRYRLTVDQRDVGFIRNEEILIVAVEPGVHTVEARIDWCRSRPLTVTVLPDHAAPVEVGTNVPNNQPSGAIFTMMFQPSDYLYLKPA
jgi:hypothetical protein